MYRSFLVAAALLLSASVAFAQDPPEDPKPAPAVDEDNSDVQNAKLSQDELFKKFEESLSGVRMIGRFTVDGKGDDQPLAKEEYEIRSVSKMPKGDYWLFQARIKYGEHDLVVPLPIEVTWADQTPVITLDNFTIPGLGTFGARVVIHDGKYSGMWSHGEVGGHLFGEIEKLNVDEQRE